MAPLDVLRQIQAVRVEPNLHLQITYTDGEMITVDFNPVVRQGGVFAQLSDPGFFARVAVGARGRFIRWPGDLDFCADALWMQAHGVAEVA